MADKKEKVVNLRETVKVKGIKHKTEKKQKLRVDKEYDVHPLTAKNLIDSGHAVAVKK